MSRMRKQQVPDPSLEQAASRLLVEALSDPLATVEAALTSQLLCHASDACSFATRRIFPPRKSQDSRLVKFEPHETHEKLRNLLLELHVRANGLLPRV